MPNVCWVGRTEECRTNLVTRKGGIPICPHQRCLDCCRKMNFVTSSGFFKTEKCSYHWDIDRKRLLHKEERRRFKAATNTASSVPFNEIKSINNDDTAEENLTGGKSADLIVDASSSAPLKPLSPSPAELQTLIPCIQCLILQPWNMHSIIFVFFYIYLGKSTGCKRNNNPAISDCGFCFNCCQKENFCVIEEGEEGCVHHSNAYQLRIRRKEEKYFQRMDELNERKRERNQARVKKAPLPPDNIKCNENH